MKTTFLVVIESEHEIDAETLEQNIYYRFPTSVDNVKVEKVENPPLDPGAENLGIDKR